MHDVISNASCTTNCLAPVVKVLLRRSLGPSDFNGTTYSSILDSQLTRVIDGTFCKVMAWYDNEMAYARRLVDVALLVGRSLRTR